MWSNEEYIIRESQKSELSFIITMIDDYLNEETIYQSFVKENISKFSEEEKQALKKCVYDFVLHTVNNHPSLVAIHVPSQKIVGHLILAIVEKPLLSTDSSKSSLFPSPSPETPETLLILLENLGEFSALKESFEKYPGVEKLARMSLLGVNKEYRGKGLSKRLLQCAVDWSTEKGFKLAQGTFSSSPSKRAAECVGFRSLWDFDLRNYRNKQGEAVFADAGENNLVSTMVLELKQ